MRACTVVMKKVSRPRLNEDDPCSVRAWEAYQRFLAWDNAIFLLPDSGIFATGLYDLASIVYCRVYGNQDSISIAYLMGWLRKGVRDETVYAESMGKNSRGRHYRPRKLKRLR